MKNATKPLKVSLESSKGVVITKCGLALNNGTKTLLSLLIADTRTQRLVRIFQNKKPLPEFSDYGKTRQMGKMTNILLCRWLANAFGRLSVTIFKRKRQDTSRCGATRKWTSIRSRKVFTGYSLVSTTLAEPKPLDFGSIALLRCAKLFVSMFLNHNTLRISCSQSLSINSAQPQLSIAELDYRNSAIYGRAGKMQSLTASIWWDKWYRQVPFLKI